MTHDTTDDTTRLYRTDQLRITDETDAADVVAFIERSIDPIYIEDATVWNFSNHPFRPDRFRSDIENPAGRTFVLPFQVTTTWGLMLQLLPKPIQMAEPVLWRGDQYEVYDNYLAQLGPQRRVTVQQSLVKRLLEQGDYPE